MCADMRNSYFGFNVLTRVLPFLHASKRIHHIIEKHQCLGSLKESLINTYVRLQSEAVNVKAPLNSTKRKFGNRNLAFILRIILKYQYIRGKDSGFFIAKQVLHIATFLL